METDQSSQKAVSPGAPETGIAMDPHAPRCASCGDLLPTTFEQATIRDLVALERMRLTNERLRLESKAREQESNDSRAGMIYALLPTLLAQFETLFGPKPSSTNFPGVASPDFNGVAPAPAPATPSDAAS
jgi:hypothetical protein